MTFRKVARKKVHELKSVTPRFASNALRWAFPAPSENEMCEQAARWLGASPDTYRRILREETQRVDLREILPIVAIAAASKGLDLFELLGTPHVESGRESDRPSLVDGAGSDREREGETLEEPRRPLAKSSGRDAA